MTATTQILTWHTFDVKPAHDSVALMETIYLDGSNAIYIVKYDMVSDEWSFKDCEGGFYKGDARYAILSEVIYE